MNATGKLDFFREVSDTRKEYERKDDWILSNTRKACLFENIITIKEQNIYVKKGRDRVVHLEQGGKHYPISIE